MRICLYVGKAAPPEQQDEWLANATSTCDVYARNLHREFTSRGHQVVFASSLSAQPKDQSHDDYVRRVQRYLAMSFPEADHAICLEQNGWNFRERIFFDGARAATGGLVCAICDHDHFPEGPQDILFTSRRPTRITPRSRYVGWAADPEMFTPEKDPEWLTIFVDHKYDYTERADDTEALLKSATAYAASLAAQGRRVGEPPRRVQVVFFSPGGIDRIEAGEVRDIYLGNDRRTFYRRVPGPELAAWTRKTDLFVVTHSESMGLPVLENAMAGARILTRKGFVQPELLNSLEHREYRSLEEIDWDDLVQDLRPDAFRQRASHFTWSRVAERMLDALQEHDRVSAAPLVVGTPAPPAHASGSDEHIAACNRYKHPWPEPVTLRFEVDPDQATFAARISGEFEDEGVEVQFDTATLSAELARASHGWTLLDAQLHRQDKTIAGTVVACSDWAPIVRARLLLPQAADRSEADVDVAGLRISRLCLETEEAVAAHQSEPVETVSMTPKAAGLTQLLLGQNPYDGFPVEQFPADEQAQPRGWGFEHWIFEDILERARPGLVIEVGSWKGGSAIKMASIGKALDLDTAIVCVDTWLGSSEHLLRPERNRHSDAINRRWGYPQLYFTFLANVLKWQCQDRIVPFPSTSENAAIVFGKLGLRAGVIYIDAAHEYEPALRDFSVYWDLLEDGGYLVGDDYLGWEGVTRAADEFAERHGVELLGTHGKFLIRKGQPIPDSLRDKFRKIEGSKEAERQSSRRTLDMVKLVDAGDIAAARAIYEAEGPAIDSSTRDSVHVAAMRLALALKQPELAVRHALRLNASDRYRAINRPEWLFEAAAVLDGSPTHRGAARAIRDLLHDVGTDHPEIYLRILASREAKGDDSGANLIVDQVLGTAMDHPQLAERVVRRLQASGRAADAIALCRRQLESTPDQPQLLNRLARLLLLHCECEALPVLDRLRALDPASEWAPLTQAKLLQKLSREPEARRIVDEFLAQRPDNANALAMKARLDWKAGQRTQAAIAARKAIELSPPESPLKESMQALLNKVVT